MIRKVARKFVDTEQTRREIEEEYLNEVLGGCQGQENCINKADTTLYSKKNKNKSRYNLALFHFYVDYKNYLGGLLAACGQFIAFAGLPCSFVYKIKHKEKDSQSYWLQPSLYLYCRGSNHYLPENNLTHIYFN